MDANFDQEYPDEINSEPNSDKHYDVSNKLFEETIGTPAKLPIGAGAAAEKGDESKTSSDGKKPPPFEIVDDKDPESKRDAAIQEAAKQIKNGKFTDDAKTVLLEALNTGDTDAARRKSLTETVNKINKELLKLYKETGEKDPSKIFEVRFQNIKGADGTYDKLKIGLQSQKRTIDYNDSFMIRPKK